jgi:hypothetical protein
MRGGGIIFGQRGGFDTAQVTQSNELTACGTNPLLPACAAAAGFNSLAGSRFFSSLGISLAQGRAAAFSLWCAARLSFPLPQHDRSI